MCSGGFEVDSAIAEKYREYAGAPRAHIFYLCNICLDYLWRER